MAKEKATTESDNLVELLKTNLKLKEEITATKEGTNKTILSLEREVRILSKSLHLSYCRYASITSRKLLEVLAKSMVYSHPIDENDSLNSQWKCKTIRKELEDDQTHHPSLYICLDHLSNCALGLEYFIQHIPDISACKGSLNRFIHSISGLDEVIIQDSDLHAELLSQVIKQLKTKFSSQSWVQSLPDEVITLNETAKHENYKKFKCYQDVLAEEPQSYLLTSGR